MPGRKNVPSTEWLSNSNAVGNNLVYPVFEEWQSSSTSNAGSYAGSNVSKEEWVLIFSIEKVKRELRELLAFGIGCAEVRDQAACLVKMASPGTLKFLEALKRVRGEALRIISRQLEDDEVAHLTEGAHDLACRAAHVVREILVTLDEARGEAQKQLFEGLV